jgi:protein SCO1/2
MKRRTALSLVLLSWPVFAFAHGSKEEGRLPLIGEAPDFTLTAQDGTQFSLKQLRGKVVAVTFIYTFCPDTCPLLTDKMARVQDRLGTDFGKNIDFVSITVDPERDTPGVLKEYAGAYGANLKGWHFLTGEAAAIADVERRYGVVARKAADGGIDHTFLTSLIDSKGNLRVQYLGYRFDVEEFRHDLLDLLGESRQD